MERYAQALTELEAKEGAAKTFKESSDAKSLEIKKLLEVTGKLNSDLKTKSSEAEKWLKEKADLQSSVSAERQKTRETEDKLRLAEAEQIRIQEALNSAERAKLEMADRIRKLEEETEKVNQEAVAQGVEAYKASPEFKDEFEEAACGYFIKGVKHLMDELTTKGHFKTDWAEIPIAARVEELTRVVPEEAPVPDEEEAAEPVAAKGKDKGVPSPGKDEDTGFDSDEDLPMYEVPATPIVELPELVLPAEDPIPLATIAPSIPAPDPPTTKGQPSENLPPPPAKE